jgi:twitching motility protein PilT
MIKVSAAEEMFGEILRRMVESGSSDLHLKTGLPPVVRLNDELRVLSRKYPSLSLEDLDGICQAVMPKHLRDLYQNGQEVDLSYSIAGLGRFRLNIYRYRGNIGIVARHIPLVIRSLESLGLPSVVQKFAVQPRGLLLITGITGSGKSTSVAACLNEWNQHRSGHIVTIEDPIEYVLADKKSIITQREVGIDTESFAIGLRNALRQDPDVIMIGELRDKETIQTALAAAETGHLVISTLHTKDAIETINRIIGVFEPEAQNEVRLQFSACLSAIVSQRLLAKDTQKNRAGLVVAAEVLVNTPFVKSCLLDPTKTDQLRQAMEQGLDTYGMQTFDQSLMQLFKRGLISREVAVENATSPSDFDLRLRGIRTQDEGKWESLDKNPRPPTPTAPSQSPNRPGQTGVKPPSSAQARSLNSTRASQDTGNVAQELPGATLELDHPHRKERK